MYDLEFSPKKEEELYSLLEQGEGNFEVIAAEKKNSKNGNPMIKITMKVWDKSGNSGIIYDYLMINEKNFSLRKIRHFCYSSNLIDKYEQGKLNSSDCLGRHGNCEIAIQKDESGKYPPKNIISDYVISEKNINYDSSLNDDLPF